MKDKNWASFLIKDAYYWPLNLNGIGIRPNESLDLLAQGRYCITEVGFGWLATLSWSWKASLTLLGILLDLEKWLGLKIRKEQTYHVIPDVLFTLG